MDLLDFLGADAEIQAALFMLKEINEKPECKTAPNGYTDEYSPQVYVCFQSIIKCKRLLHRTVTKKDKEHLEHALARMREYIVRVDRDEQKKILKYVQP